MSTSKQEPKGEIAALRREIEEVDQRIVSLIAARCRLAEAVGERKRASGLPTLDPAHEAVVVRRAAVRARAEQVDEEGVREVFWRLIGLAHAVQRQGRAGEAP